MVGICRDKNQQTEFFTFLSAIQAYNLHCCNALIKHSTKVVAIYFDFFLVLVLVAVVSDLDDVGAVSICAGGLKLKRNDSYVLKTACPHTTLCLCAIGDF